ncbi:MAG: hypothetical protein K8S97_07390 [Anaerolineae bacterium]|nr:hypothetical protein [Anaerolineae bacterium]
MTQFSRPLTLCLLLALTLALLPLPVGAQDGPFPLPAPLYILASDGMVLALDQQTGAQTQISNANQPVADFDVAPDGQWIAFRTADEGMVIVSNLNGFGGYVLNFEGHTPPAPSPAKTLAWSPDGGVIAYIVPGGVELAYTGAGFYGEPAFGMVQGPWVELYWEAAGLLIVSDTNGAPTRIRGALNDWVIEPAPDVPARTQPLVPSYLSADGVILASGTPVPGTAGALAFAWGPLPLPPLVGYPLPATLYFIAPDASGIDQVWALGPDGTLPQQITFDVDPVVGYSLNQDRTQIAYVAGDALLTAPVGTTPATILTLLALEFSRPQPIWSPDGAQIAYHDERGTWLIPAAGGTPTLVAQSVPFTELTEDIGVLRYYADPRWSPDGSQLLLTIGLWEGAGLGVLDLASGTITEMLYTSVAAGRWTDDGRVLAWSSFFGYSEPGLLLLDPAQPDAEPLHLINNKPVYDVIPGADGLWYALVGDSAAMGPVFARVWQAASLNSPFGPVFPGPAGGFAEYPVLAARDGQFVIAGLRVQPTETGPQAGTLILIDVGYNFSGELAGQPAPPIHTLTWGS